MSIAAVWTANFQTRFGSSTGVVIFDTQRMCGGDGEYLYVGTYRVKDDEVAANMLVRRHHILPGVHSAFGPLEQFRIALSGPIGEQRMVLEGQMLEGQMTEYATKENIYVDFIRQQELP